MLKGYKATPWGDSDSHFYVPSVKNFSLVLNYDIPAICIPAAPTIFTLIAGLITLFSGAPIVGVLLLAYTFGAPLLLLWGYKGSRSLSRREYSNWLDVEKAYAKMSKADQRRHRKTLKDAFHDSEVAILAEEIFTELGVDKDLSRLQSELEQIREQKKILKEFGS